MFQENSALGQRREESANHTQLPRVSVLTFSRGQAQFDDNMLLNVLYQTYPHHLLELLVLDTGKESSKVWKEREEGEMLTKWARAARLVEEELAEAGWQWWEQA